MIYMLLLCVYLLIFGKSNLRKQIGTCVATSQTRRIIRNIYGQLSTDFSVSQTINEINQSIKSAARKEAIIAILMGASV